MDLHLKSLFGRFNEQFGSGPGLGPGSGTCLMNVAGVTPGIIKSLHEAAAALLRTDPWKRLRPRHLLGVRVGKDSEWPGEKQLFSCLQFIGGDGGDLALYLFRSESDALKVTRPRKTLRIPNVDVLRVTFEKESLLPPSQSPSKLITGTTGYLPVFDFVSCNSDGELRFRNPAFEELRFLYAVMRAVPLVHPLLRLQDEVVELPHLACFEPFIETVDVQWLPDLVKKSGHDFVAVAVSHPPGHSYDQEKPGGSSSSPTSPPGEPLLLGGSSQS